MKRPAVQSQLPMIGQGGDVNPTRFAIVPVSVIDFDGAVRERGRWEIRFDKLGCQVGGVPKPYT